MKISDKIFLSLLMISALLVRIFVFSQNIDEPGDGMYRMMLAMNWVKDPYFVMAGIWPPLHLYMSAIMIKILDNPFFSTRLLSLIFGTLIVIPYYYLVKLLFDERAASISAVIISFVGIFIQYSTYSMSEIPFVFFILTSLYFLFISKKEKRTTNLILSAIFLNFASMLRFEGWLFIPLMTILAFDIKADKKTLGLRYDKNELRKDFKNIFMFVLVSLIFPIIWLVGSYLTYKDPFFSQHYADNWIRISIMLDPNNPWLNPPLLRKLTTWPIELLVSLDIVAIFASIGLLISLFRKEHLEFLFIFFILLSFFTYKVFNGTMTRQSRYIISAIPFFIPYFVIGIDYLLDKIEKFNIVKKEKLNRIIPVTLICIFLVLSSYTAVAKNENITPGYVYDVSKWLKNNLKSNETVLLDEYNWWGLHILFFSGLDTRFKEDHTQTSEFITDQLNIVAGSGEKIDEDDVIHYLNRKPNYVIYSPKGRLSKVLNFSTECKEEKKFNYSFECVYSTENYNIYKLG